MDSGKKSHRDLRENLTLLIQSTREVGNIRAGILETPDREYAISLVKNTATACNAPLYQYSLHERLRYNPDKRAWDPVGSGSSDMTSLLRQASKEHGAVIFERCLPFLSDDGGDIQAYVAFSRILSSGNNGGLAMIFMEPPGSERMIPSMLSDQFVRLRVKYPHIAEMETISREEITYAAHRASEKMDAKDVKLLAKRHAPCLVGLTYSAARDNIRDALVSYPRNPDAVFQWLQARKVERLRNQLAMNVLDASDAEMPIGLDYLFDYLNVIKDRIRVFGPDRAKGIILIGPPGCGKTMLALCIANLLDLPVVEFRISSLMNSLLGETEKQFARAYAALEAMAPNVVFIDEIEKIFGESSERDGGTMTRCIGSFLSWLSNNPYQNYVVAATNSLKKMGEIGLTMTRSERFDSAFFLDIPNLDSRRRMLERWLDDADMASEIAGITHKFSGADLRSVVKQATARAEHGKTRLTMDILESEIQKKRMRAIAVYDGFEELRRFGRLYCEPAGPTQDSES